MSEQNSTTEVLAQQHAQLEFLRALPPAPQRIVLEVDAPRGTVRRRVERDAEGLIEAIIEEPEK